MIRIFLLFVNVICVNGYLYNWLSYCNGRGRFANLEMQNNRVCYCDRYKKWGTWNYMYGGDTCEYESKCWIHQDCYKGICQKNLCVCATGWEGDFCNIEKLDETRCKHGGTSDSVTEYRAISSRQGYYMLAHGGESRWQVPQPCQCKGYYYGETCELEADWVCNYRGRYTDGQCVCMDGFSGNSCSVCDTCNHGTCTGTVAAPQSKCTCDNGWKGDLCNCNDDMCLNGGLCNSAGGCDCKEGFVGPHCAGHGICEDTTCTCDDGWEGDYCNICNGCNVCSDEAIWYTGDFIEKENYVIHVEPKGVEHHYREFNKAPMQALKIPDITNVQECAEACETPVNGVPYTRRILGGWADKRDWETECNDRGYTDCNDILLDHIPSLYSATITGWNMAGWATRYWLGVAYQVKREISKTNYWNPTSGRYSRGVRFWDSDTKTGFQSQGIVDRETFISTWSNTHIPLKNEFNVPPKYYYSSPDSSNIGDITHFGFSNGVCLCYTQKESDEGKEINIKVKKDLDPVWDKMWGNGQAEFTTTTEIVKSSGTGYFYRKNAGYCVNCPDGKFAVDNPDSNIKQCCPEYMGGRGCARDVTCDSNPCGTGIICLDSDDDYSIERGNWECRCTEGLTGMLCNLECCVRGNSVDNMGLVTAVNGDCDHGVGGCRCDYGFKGYYCQCSEDMCENGYCKPDISEKDFTGVMCGCNPGSIWDPNEEKCVDVNECDGINCGYGTCVNLKNDYMCKCNLGYIGEHCETSTMWNDGKSTCPVNTYLISGRCIDCPFGTYSLVDDTTCRVKLTDDNIHDAVEEAMSDDPYYVVSRLQICTTGSMNSLNAQTAQDCFEACSDDTVSIIVTGFCYCVVQEVDIASSMCQEAMNSVYKSAYDSITETRYEIWSHSESEASIYTKIFNNFYGDIETFDTSEVTNMDNLFMNRVVPDISRWEIRKVTSMRNMFAGSTGVFDKWTIAGSVDTTNIYAGSDLELQFVERTSGSCLDSKESLVRPVMTKEECLLAQYDASVTFTEKVTVHPLMANAGRRGCRYAADSADSHEFDFTTLVENDLESCDDGGTCCTADVPCLCAKIREGEYVKASSCEGIYEEITTTDQCTIAVRHLGEFYGVMDLTDGKCLHSEKYICKMRTHLPCPGTGSDCIHNGLLCKSGVIIDDVCKVDNDALKVMVQLWNLHPAASLWLYGPLKDWDVHYVTDTTDLFKDMQKNPDIRNWDMTNVVHADRMFKGSLFNYALDNKDFSSLQTASEMFPPPTDYTHRVCGKHFLRAGKPTGSTGFENHGTCLTSDITNDKSKSVIKQAVDDWFDGNSDAVIAMYGEMSEWDVSEVTSMTGLFETRTVTEKLSKWDTGNVEFMNSMFKSAIFNEDIRHWDVRKVTDFSQMFSGNSVFAVDLTSWELHASTTTNMFSGSEYYTGNIFMIDTTLPDILTDNNFKNNALTDIDSAEGTYGPISEWMTHMVTDMSHAFENKQFNKDISKWVVSSVTDMSYMFAGSTFNGDISGWQVVNVENMQGMFMDNKHFNQMIDRWNVSNVNDMSSMFKNSVFSRPIGDWDLFGTEPKQIQAANDDTNKCSKSMGKMVNLDGYNRASQAAIRQCFDMCSNIYPMRLDDIEGRNRDRGGGRVGAHYTPFVGGFGIVTNELFNHTCMCADETKNCDNGVTSPFDYVYDYRDMLTTDMFKNNEHFVQPLCGLGWRYRDISSLNDHQEQVSTTCGICNLKQHMSECGLCLGEFRFDKCLDSPIGFTLQELMNIDPRLLVDANGVPLEDDDSITDSTKVNKVACNCDYEDSLRGCLVVNGRRQVRMTEWYANGPEDFTSRINANTQYFCELDYLDDRPVASAVGFNSVICTEDTLLDRAECGLVGGNWDGQCDKCLQPCLPPELGVKYFSNNRVCTVCDSGLTLFQNECVLCPSGKFTNEDQAYCGKCPQGTYGENGICKTCGNGHFSSYEGAISCAMCDAGMYSIGTNCVKCADGFDSTAGSDVCEEIRYCHHGNTSETGERIGNFCLDNTCDNRFKYVNGTCVSVCEHGIVSKINGYSCECNDKWTGENCNECNARFNFTYLDPKKCEENPCTDTLITDCACRDTIAKEEEGEYCYEGLIKNECAEGGSECMCSMGDGYEWAPLGTVCIGGVISEPCGLFDGNSVPLEPCSNADFSCKFGLKEAFCTGAFACTEDHFVLGGDCCNAGYCSYKTCPTDHYNTGGEYLESDTECCLPSETCNEARDRGLECGKRADGWNKPATDNLRAIKTFQTLDEFDRACCTEYVFRVHPLSDCSRYFENRELSKDECIEYDMPAGYKDKEYTGDKCIMKRTLGTTTKIDISYVVCVQEL